jgi:branched-chain amino acid transport system substrate-binding protein
MLTFIIRLLVLVVCLGLSQGSVAAQEPIYIALSAPITGNYAEYGENFTRAITLALDEINMTGGIHGRPVELLIGDSKGVPKESAMLAQKFVSDPRVVAQIGDFTSTCSLAAQSIYHRAGMVQLAPTSTHPDFAPGSPYSFSIAGRQTEEGPFMARFAVETLGKTRIAFCMSTTTGGLRCAIILSRKIYRLGSRNYRPGGVFRRNHGFYCDSDKIPGPQS